MFLLTSLILVTVLLGTVLTPALAQAGTIDWPTFKKMLTDQKIQDPYALINWLDAQSQKLDHPAGGWQVSCSGQPAVVWTGLYIKDDTLGGKAKKLLVDGQTGVYIINDNTTVPTTGGSVCLSNFDGNVPNISVEFSKKVVQVWATECAETTSVKNIIDTWSSINKDQVFVNLDALVDNRPTVRLRASQPGVIKNVEAEKVLLWTSGDVSNSKLLLESNGKKLVIATGGQMNVDHAFSGVQLCTPLDASPSTPTQPAPTNTAVVPPPANTATATPDEPKFDITSCKKVYAGVSLDIAESQKADHCVWTVLSYEEKVGQSVLDWFNPLTLVPAVVSGTVGLGLLCLQGLFWLAIAVIVAVLIIVIVRAIANRR